MDVDRVGLGRAGPKSDPTQHEKSPIRYNHVVVGCGPGLCLNFFWKKYYKARLDPAPKSTLNLIKLVLGTMNRPDTARKPVDSTRSRPDPTHDHFYVYMIICQMKRSS